MQASKLLLVLSLCVVGQADDDEDFQDTPILSSLWEATSQANNDAIDRLLDSSPSGIKARASDGRGLAFWAYEFQNAYALASIEANGGDIASKDEDLGGQTAEQMCEQNAECDKKALVEKAKGMVDDIQKRQEERKVEREKADAEDEDDPDFDSEGSGDEAGDDEF